MRIPPDTHETEKTMFPLELQHFIVSLLFHLCLPLLPLVVEYMFTGNLSQKSLVLTGSIYCFTIAVSSKYMFIFAAYLLIGIILSFYYGVCQIQVAEVFPIHTNLTFWAVVLVFLTHAIERWRRHCILCEPYIIFQVEKENKSS